jgi:hypothetical protein
MRYCKKYKAAQTAQDFHHRKPGGDCRSCVYFSHMNCRQHTEDLQSISMV